MSSVRKSSLNRFICQYGLGPYEMVNSMYKLLTVCTKQVERPITTPAFYFDWFCCPEKMFAKRLPVVAPPKVRTDLGRRATCALTHRIFMVRVQLAKRAQKVRHRS